MTQKTNILLVSLLVVLILGLAGVTYTYTRIITEKTVEGHQQGLAKEAAKIVELWLDQRLKIIEATAGTVQQMPLGNTPDILDILKMVMRSGDFSDVYIGLADGTMIDGADWVPPSGYDPRIRPWYRRAITTDRLALTRPYLDLTTRKMVIAIVTPLWKNGRFLGVLSSDIILDTLEKSVMDLKIGEAGHAFIIDSQGTVLVHPDENLLMTTRIQDSAPGLAGFETIFSNAPSGSFQYDSRDQEKMISFQKLSSTGWYFCTSVARDEAYALAKNTAMLFAMGMVLKSLGILALLFFLVVGGSALILAVSRQRFRTIVSGKDRDLKEIETRYRTLFNMATNAIMLSRNFAFIECNEKTLAMFGMAKEDIIGKSMLDLSPASQEDGMTSRENMDRIMTDLVAGEQDIFRWTFRRADGTEFPSEVGLRMLRLDSEMVAVYSIWDISKRVNAEQHLRQAQKLAAMGEMLSAIAHQWRQPLNALSTYIAALPPAFYNGKLTREFVETLVRESDSQIQFMSRTINDFRQYFRPSKNKQAFDVLTAVDNAVKLIRPQLKQNAILLQLDMPPRESPLPVFGYENEFVHVLVNIISNAKDAIKERQDSAGSQKINRLIDLSVETRQNQVILTVKDTGCGIPPHLMAKIFTPYFTTKGTATGTGIGLYMAKMIVEKEMHGQVRVEKQSIGARFVIQLPLSVIREVHA